MRSIGREKVEDGLGFKKRKQFSLGKARSRVAVDRERLLALKAWKVVTEELAIQRMPVLSASFDVIQLKTAIKSARFLSFQDRILEDSCA